MLPAAERLKANALFAQVFQAGRSIPESLIVLHLQVLPDSPHVRETGFSVSKRVGNAVVRNRTKRRLRAAMAELLAELPRGFRAVVVARGRAATADYPALVAALRRAYGRAGLLKGPATST